MPAVLRVFLIPALLLWMSAGLFADQFEDFTYSSDGMAITITAYTGAGGAVTIPNTIAGLAVTEIGDRAFYSQPSLTSVVVPSSVASIGVSSFESCTGLTSIALPSGLGTISERAFYFCRDLTGLIIPDTVTSIGPSAFYRCGSLVSISIPDSVTSIGPSAFTRCSGLTEVHIGAGVRTIGAGAFYRCSRLSSIVIPSSVTSIGNFAFRYCSSLLGAGFFGDAPTMGDSVFSDTASGFNIHFSSAATGFASPTWEGYPALGVTDGTIIAQPFSSTVLTASTATMFVSVMGGVPSTFEWFQGVSGDTSMPVGSNTASFTSPLLNATSSYWVRVTNASNPTGVDSSSATITVIPQPLVINGPITWLVSRNATFNGIVNPNGSTIAATFEYGTSTAYGNSIVASFSPKDGNENVDLASTLGPLNALPDDTVYHYRLVVTNAGGTTIGDDRTFITKRVSGDYYYTTNDDTATIVGYAGAGGAITIPETIDGLQVTGIGFYAFFSEANLVSVSIPASVTHIGEHAFASCTGLKSVSIPDSVVSIGRSAFKDCSALTSVSIPDSVASIGFDSFDDCSALSGFVVDALNPVFSSSQGVLFNKDQSTIMQYPPGLSGAYAIPNSVTSIGEHGFSTCGGLTKMTIPSSVINIGDYAFRQCTALTNAIIPSSVTSIGRNAFTQCTSLIGVEIPDSVTRIEMYTFANCTSLTSVGIPASITHLGHHAFIHCTQLTAAAFSGDAPNEINDPFFGVASGFTAYFLNGATGFTNPPWLSGYASLEVADGSIVVQPSTVVIAGGTTGTLAVTAISAAPLTYQWYQGMSGDVSVPVGTSSAIFSSPPLTESTSYWVRVSSLGNPGSVDSDTATITVAVPALVTTGSATWDGNSKIVFTGAVNPNGNAATALFEYGPTSSYGQSLSVALSPNDGTAFVDVSAELSDFGGDATYHYRLTVTTIGGTVFGEDRLFINERVSGDFTYTTNDETAIVTRYSGPGGAVMIPDVINGLMVTGIGIEAFRFSTRVTNVTIPDGVTSIGERAFSYCLKLSSVTIPSSVTSIGLDAFDSCFGLNRTIFLGDAPTMASSVFSRTAGGFTTYFLAGANGFTTPEWQGYPSVMIDQSLYPAALWLVSHDLDQATALHQDSNGDGVSLLMAYALDLDPRLNLPGHLPVPNIDDSTLSITFYGARPGIVYSVETSADLSFWETEGVTLSAPDSAGLRTASVNRSSDRRFLRLVVED